MMKIHQVMKCHMWVENHARMTLVLNEIQDRNASKGYSDNVIHQATISKLITASDQ